jgi:hypothetical protein
MQKPGVNVLCVIDTSPSRSAQPRFAAARKVWLHARARSAALHLAFGACSVNARVWLCSYALNLTLTHSPSLSCIADRHPQLARQRRRVRAHDHTALPSQPHHHNHTIVSHTLQLHARPLVRVRVSLEVQGSAFVQWCVCATQTRSQHTICMLNIHRIHHHI